MADNGGRVTTRELYAAILQINKDREKSEERQDDKREKMELRIMDRLDASAPLVERVNSNTKAIELNTGKAEINHLAIDDLKLSDKKWGIGIGAISVAFTALIAWIKGS